MYIVGRPAIYAVQLLFSLFITNSALPTKSQVREMTTDLPINVSLGLDNETLVRLPNGIPWSPTSQVFVPYPVPNTAVTLNFTYFGYKIPVVRALSIIDDARQEVLSHLASSSEDAPTNHFFEYSTHATSSTAHVCSVIVQTYGGFGLSWLQLDQILEGLTQFTSAAGIDRQVHYQALQFEINLADTGRVGIGLLWCTPGQSRGLAEVEERATTEVPIAHQELDERALPMSGLANETFPNSSNNASGLMLSSAPEVFFPVPGTNIDLAFIWLGNPIPSQMVNDALHGAFLKIAPFLKESGSRPIPRNRFFYWAPAGKFQQIAIQIYGMVQLSWSQVDSIIMGLFQFSNGIGTPHEEEHFKNLGFDVKDENGRTIGYGNLLAIPIDGVDNTVSIVNNNNNNEKRSTATPPLIVNST